jgi:hypothetical protein
MTQGEDNHGAPCNAPKKPRGVYEKILPLFTRLPCSQPALSHVGEPICLFAPADGGRIRNIPVTQALFYY